MKRKSSSIRKIICSSAVICTAAFSQNLVAQAPVDASNGVDFGPGANDPKLKKSSSNTDLQLELEDDSALSIYPNSNANPTFMAGEGHEANVTAGKWYRIAKASGKLRANAVFSLRDSATNGSHSTAVFRAGMSYNDASSMGVTLLSHSYFSVPCFTKVRILKSNNVNGDQYLEVWTNWGTPAHTAPVRYSIQDNLGDGGWEPVDWEITENLPATYSSNEYDINKLFAVGRTSNILSVDYDGTVSVDGSLNVQSSPVLTQATAPSLLAGQFVTNSGDASGTGSTALGFGTRARGDYSTTLGYNTYTGDFNGGGGFGALAGGYGSRASGSLSFAIGYDTVASGEVSIAMNYYTTAAGRSSTAMGDHTTARSHASLAIGRYNEERSTEAGQTSWTDIDQNSVLEVGIGTSSNKQNALTVMKDGSVEIGKDSADDSVPLHVTADGSVILSKAQGDISMGAFGE